MHPVVVGAVLGAHGVRGGMRILVLTDVPERFDSMKTLVLYTKKGDFFKEIPLTSLRPLHGKPQMLVFSPMITSRDEAESLKGLEIRASRESRPPLEKGEFWIDDLVGLSVVDHSTGDLYGTLHNVVSTGASDVYVVATSGGKELLFPAISSVVLHVDLEKGIVKVRPPEGLWEE